MMFDRWIVLYIIKIFLQDVENVTLKLANKMFISKNFAVKQEYKQDLETYYRSDIQSVDFGKSEEAANIVNTWCKEKTNNRINQIISAGKERSTFHIYSFIIQFCDDRKFYAIYLFSAFARII